MPFDQSPDSGPNPLLGAVAAALDEAAAPITFEELQRSPGPDPVIVPAAGLGQSGDRDQRYHLLFAVAVVIAAIGLGALLVVAQRASDENQEQVAGPAAPVPPVPLPPPVSAPAPVPAPAPVLISPIPPPAPAPAGLSPVPLDGDLPTTGVWQSPHDLLVVWMAEDLLLTDCMVESNLTYVAPSQDELIRLFGGWSPHRVLGLRTEGAARQIGYQGHGVGGLGTPSQAAALEAMSEVERARYLDALLADSRDDPSPSTASDIGGCRSVAEAQLSDYRERDYALYSVLEQDINWDHAGRVAEDPRVIEMLEEWERCVRGAVGTIAKTPDELARRFAFDGSPDGTSGATDVEIATAVADARCQKRTDLQRRHAQVDAEIARASLGDRVADYDELTRLRVEITQLARGVLADRGVTPPSLD